MSNSLEEPDFLTNFNQDGSSLFIGGKNGYSLFGLSTPHIDLEEVYRVTGEDCRIVERMFSSSLLAIVTMNSPRKMKVFHYKRGTEICNYSYSSSVLAIKLNRVRLVVCMNGSLYIHSTKDMLVKHTIRETPLNPNGLIALSPNADHSYLAYPGSTTTGELQLFDAINYAATVMIRAHDSPLAAVTFSFTGLQLATASEKGTVIRVFSSESGTKLFEFRRGVKRCVSIVSMAFSHCSNYLCCSSNTETVHIFKFEPLLDAEKKEVAESNQNSWGNYLKNMIPANVTDVFTQGRGFASAIMPVAGLRHSCAITTIESQLRLLIAASSGYLYVYNILPEGGECQVIRKHDLRNIPSIYKTPKYYLDLRTPADDMVSVATARMDQQPAGPSYASALKGNVVVPAAVLQSDKTLPAKD